VLGDIAVEIGAELFVLGLGERNGHGAVGVAALADELDHVEAGAGANLFEAFVDFAEERFVARKSLLAPFTSLVGRQLRSSFVTMKKWSFSSTTRSPSS
jgi:hypothetical protein